MNIGYFQLVSYASSKISNSEIENHILSIVSSELPSTIFIFSSSLSILSDPSVSFPNYVLEGS